jgi:serine protease inhibitor
LQPYGPGLQLETANSLWCSHERPPRSEYVAKIKEHYDAEVVALDFQGAETVARVNSWVSAKTRGKIGSILSTIDPLTGLLAINAVYFKGLWGAPFERELTRAESFCTSDGRTLKVPLMCQYGYYSYYEESEFQAIGLRYKSGVTGLTMYILLPAKTSNLREFQQNLTAAFWDQWMGRFKSIEGQIGLPRFMLTYGANLKGALDKLGMGIAFDPRRARFDTINLPPPELWISQIFHQAFVQVNEEGTEAAAITDATEYFSSEEPQPTHF